MLLLSVISTVAQFGPQAAFAEKGGDKGKSSHGKGDKGNSSQEKDDKNKQEKDTTTSESEEKDKDKKVKDSGNESKKSAKKALKERLNQTADEIHKKHLKMDAGFSGPYNANLTY